MFSFKKHIFWFCCALMLAASGNEADSAVKPQEQQKGREKAVSEMKKTAGKLPPHSGKIAVIKRLQSLFSGDTNPVIMQTRKFTPQPPYISVHELPGNETSPARSLIIYRLRFMAADSKTQDAIEGIVGESGTVEISEKQNTVVINIPKDRAEAVKAAVLALDQPIPQVLVETQVIEIMVEQGEERDVQMQYREKDGKTGTIDTYGYNLSPVQSGNAGQASGFNFFPVSKVYSDGGFKQFQVALNWRAW